MSSNSEIILSQTSHSSANLDPETVTGDKFKGDGFYGRSDGIHTVQYSVTDLAGTVTIQATLAAEPGEADWFSVYEQSYPLDGDNLTTRSNISNFTGNYVWIRAKVDYTEGTVDRILLNH
jgi:hypothetical protein